MIYDNITNNLNSFIYTNVENNNENFYLALTITEVMAESDYENGFTMEAINEMLEKIFTPYPDENEIPVLKIKNDDCFFNEKKIIQSQLPKLHFVDSKFNKCKECQNDNQFFCEKCKKNICKECSNKCENDGHNLINLKEVSIEIEIKKKQIKSFISKIHNDSKKNKKPISSSWIIALIKAIIKQDYNNYFHYKNINECHRYLQIYEEFYNNAFLKIEYTINEDINNKQIEKEYKIFGKIFVENNKDKIFLRVNGNKLPLTETIKISNSDKLIEVILIKNSENTIEDLSYMFCNCKSRSIKIIEIEERTKFLKKIQI